MPEDYSVLADQLNKRISRQIERGTNQTITQRHVEEVKISGYRSTHAYQVYKRGRLLNNFAVIGRSGSGTTVGF